MKTAPPSSNRAMRDRVIRLATGAFVALVAQQCLYFRPLPHGQGAFRPIDDTKVLSLAAERQQREWVDSRAEHAYTPVQMWARDPACSTGETDDLALLHHVTLLHLNLGEMQVNRIYTHSVVEKDGVAAEEEVLG